MDSEPKGFTMIELLIVIVIIGIIAAIAIPKFANTKERAIVASMKSDLRNLVTAQEGYLADFQTYTTDLGNRFVETTGISVTIQGVSSSGWAATASHVGSVKTCAIFYGSGATPVAPATREGESKCS
ncbi:MAG: prepilin-type N-terminal cleavage/methylation domain-containing protein [Gemmatimonadales bacterium]|nr:prepilin-type N-terminal cleavage/methylation domain-containing protein [Gemmatimonadales bacterium]NIN11455.1 prepilin-type N-terminal cleavage/methylation domain-containing protein [Gemmatimonadales bacterium]NIN50064.1 prepilin-type N-terminal cleavage/methylation domain-containing protein [Gemmatimonadales bacterium]NIP07528.1 prepilin-type N-terminal cleavage/methylation domain-containing protein [Gemmatimonadales bacterium]NIR03170.1 prepilin-type N-terminal cleavage/methylation domain